MLSDRHFRNDPFYEVSHSLLFQYGFYSDINVTSMADDAKLEPSLLQKHCFFFFFAFVKSRFNCYYLPHQGFTSDGCYDARFAIGSILLFRFTIEARFLRFNGTTARHVS